MTTSTELFLNMKTSNSPPPYMVNGSGAVNGAVYAFDGSLVYMSNTTGFWRSSPDLTGWLSVDLGESVKLSGFNVYSSPYFEGGTVANRNPKSFTVQTSEDGIIWVDVKSYQTAVWTKASEKRTFDFDSISSFRYLRFNNITPHGNQYATVGEISFNIPNITNKFLLSYSDRYYYYNGSWTMLSTIGLNSEDFKTYGMDSIGSEIGDFIASYGNNFKILRWSNEDTSSLIQLRATPLSQLVYPTGDVSLVGVESIDKITLLSTGNAKITISFDNGITQKAFKNGIWETVENAHSGMTNLEINALTSDQIGLARNGSSHVRFNYSLTDNAEVDNIEMKVSLIGSERLAPSSSFDISYEESTNKIVYSIKRASSYSVNYVDS